MYPEEEMSPYTKRIYQVLGELRVSLPTARQTAFLNRGYNRLLEEHGRQTKDKLAAQRHAAKVGRRVMSELKRLEKQLEDAGLMPDD